MITKGNGIQFVRDVSAATVSPEAVDLYLVYISGIKDVLKV